MAHIESSEPAPKAPTAKDELRRLARLLVEQLQETMQGPLPGTPPEVPDAVPSSTEDLNDLLDTWWPSGTLFHFLVLVPL